MEQPSARQWKLYKQLLRVRPTIVVDVVKQLVGFKRMIVENAEGRFWVDPISNMGVGIGENTFEPDVVQSIKANLKPGDVFIDVGANEGYYSVIAAKRVGAQGKVIAIEPQHRLLPVIAKNIELNQLSNVTVVNAAASNGAVAELAIYLNPSTNSGSSSIVNRYFIARAQKTPAKTLEAIFSEHHIATASFVKIDVEGFEPEVIEGAVNLLAAQRIERLFVDYHAAILAMRGLDAQQLHETIVRHEYRIAAGELNTSGYNLYLSSRLG